MPLGALRNELACGISGWKGVVLSCPEEPEAPKDPVGQLVPEAQAPVGQLVYVASCVSVEKTHLDASEPNRVSRH